MLTLRYRGKEGLRLGSKLRKLSTEGKLIARSTVASTIRDLVEEGFAREADHRGRRWNARVPPTGSWPLLTKTGAMRRSVGVDASGSSITITNSQPYAGYHQSGTRKMVARQWAPVKAMSRQWRERIDRAIKLSLERLT